MSKLYSKKKRQSFWRNINPVFAPIKVGDYVCSCDPYDEELGSVGYEPFEVREVVSIKGSRFTLKSVVTEELYNLYWTYGTIFKLDKAKIKEKLKTPPKFKVDDNVSNKTHGWDLDKFERLYNQTDLFVVGDTMAERFEHSKTVRQIQITSVRLYANYNAKYKKAFGAPFYEYELQNGNIVNYTMSYSALEDEIQECGASNGIWEGLNDVPTKT